MLYVGFIEMYHVIKKNCIIKGQFTEELKENDHVGHFPIIPF